MVLSIGKIACGATITATVFSGHRCCCIRVCVCVCVCEQFRAEITGTLHASIVVIVLWLNGCTVHKKRQRDRNFSSGQHEAKCMKAQRAL